VQARGRASDQRQEEREWSRGDASDIDGQTERSTWAGAHESKRGQQTSFKPFLRPLRSPSTNRLRCSHGAVRRRQCNLSGNTQLRKGPWLARSFTLSTTLNNCWQISFGLLRSALPARSIKTRQVGYCSIGARLDLNWIVGLRLRQNLVCD
jgi:hypothetical protein